MVIGSASLYIYVYVSLRVHIYFLFWENIEAREPGVLKQIIKIVKFDYRIKVEIFDSSDDDAYWRKQLRVATFHLSTMGTIRIGRS